MSAIIYNFYRESICVTCLSQNGQLIAVRDSQACILSYSELHLKPTDRICWLCHDFVQRMVAFKSRAQQAQAWLQNMANEQLVCASQVTHVGRTDTPYVTATDPLILPDIKPEPVTINQEFHNHNKASHNRLRNMSAPHILRQGHSATISPGSINSVITKPEVEDTETNSNHQNMACSYQLQQNQNRFGTPGTSYSPMIMKFETDENNYEACLSPCKLEQSHCEDFAGPVVAMPPMKPKSESYANYNQNVEAYGNSLQQNTGFTSYQVESKMAVTAEPLQIIQPRLDENNIGVTEIARERNTNSVDISVSSHQKVKPAAAIKNKTPDTAQPEYIYTETILTEGEMTQWRQIKPHTEFYARGKPTERCEKCIEPFDNHLASRAHAKSHTEAFGALVCHICQQRTLDKPAMDMHTKWHYRLLKCRYCHFVWDDVNTMRRHCRELHSIPQVLWDCDRCGRQLPSLQVWRRHDRNHQVRKTAKCPVCGLFFTSLKEHVKHHTGEIPLKTCPDCGKQCRGEASLRSHMRTHRTEVDETAFCAECNVQCRSQITYQIHLKSGKHLGKEQFRFECHDCGKRCATRGQIRSHMDTHSDTRYPCEQCGKVFNTRSSRAAHRRFVHERERRARRKYICDLCGKVYTMKLHILEHIHSHTGARPHVCGLCGDTFGYRSALYTHGRLKHNIQKKNNHTKEIDHKKKMKAAKTKHKKVSESK